MNGWQCTTRAGTLGLIFIMRNVCHLNLTISVKFAESKKNLPLSALQFQARMLAGDKYMRE